MERGGGEGQSGEVERKKKGKLRKTETKNVRYDSRYRHSHEMTTPEFLQADQGNRQTTLEQSEASEAVVKAARPSQFNRNSPFVRLQVFLFLRSQGQRRGLLFRQPVIHFTPPLSPLPAASEREDQGENGVEPSSTVAGGSIERERKSEWSRGRMREEERDSS